MTPIILRVFSSVLSHLACVSNSYSVGSRESFVTISLLPNHPWFYCSWHPGRGNSRSFFGRDVPLGKWKLIHPFTKFWPKIWFMYLPVFKNLRRFWKCCAKFMWNLPSFWEIFFSKISKKLGYWKVIWPNYLQTLGLRRGHSFTRRVKMGPILAARPQYLLTTECPPCLASRTS